MGAVSLLAVAASRPVALVNDGVVARTDAEAYVVVDTSVSMLARRSLRSPTRMMVARSAFAHLAQRLPPDLPVGLAVMPQSVLPVLAATMDRATLLQVGSRLLLAGRLPTREIASPVAPNPMGWSTSTPQPRPRLPGVATNFTALETLAVAPFYSRTAVKRLAILVTDAESAPFSKNEVRSLLRRAHIELLVLRVGSPDDRLWRTARGKLTLDRDYRPALGGVAPLASLTSRLGGHGLYRADDLPALVERARRLVGAGPARRVAGPTEPVALGPYVALASLPFLALAVGPLLPAVPRRRRRPATDRVV
jgi:hypothetical protein